MKLKDSLVNEKLKETLAELIEKTISARFDFNVAQFGAEAVELHRNLVEIQEKLSEIENNLSKAMRAKASLDREVALVKMEFQEAWDKAISKPNKRLSLSEYATGKEKSAEANLATLDQARALHRIEDVQSFAVEAVDIIRLHYYGLDKMRQDIRKRLDMSQTDYYT